MKRILVTKVSDSSIIDNRIVNEVDQTWLDQNINSGAWGKSERWLPEHLEGVETKEEVIGENETQILYLHPTEYEIEIIDLSQDYDFLLQECYQNRQKEYGSIQDQMDEQFHDFDAWKQRIQSIKDKYPKPIKEE